MKEKIKTLIKEKTPENRVKEIVRIGCIMEKYASNYSIVDIHYLQNYHRYNYILKRFFPEILECSNINFKYPNNGILDSDNKCYHNHCYYGLQDNYQQNLNHDYMEENFNISFGFNSIIEMIYKTFQKFGTFRKVVETWEDITEIICMLEQECFIEDEQYYQLEIEKCFEARQDFFIDYLDIQTENINIPENIFNKVVEHFQDITKNVSFYLENFQYPIIHEDKLREILNTINIEDLIKSLQINENSFK